MKLNKDPKNLTPSFLLRLGIGFSFLYAGANALLYPESWIAFIPPWMNAISSPPSFLAIYSIIGIAIGIGLLSGKSIRLFSMLAFWNLVLILLLYGISDATFPDIGLSLSSLALFYISFQKI